jgi:heme-degrading monooxygenase HmoA
MFAVIFEVNPKPEQWDAYLHYAKLLRPELESLDGFIDNERYGSKRREGCVLSLSTWRDEKAVIRWRTHAKHHEVQEKGRFEIFRDYHLRVGEIVADTRIPTGHTLREQRFDETETGKATLVTIVERRLGHTQEDVSPEDLARRLHLPLDDAGQSVDWDVFESIYHPGNFALLISWSNQAGARQLPPERDDEARLRQVRIIRDYGMFDRREAPQFFPPVHN